LWALQGENRAWFCGSYFGSGFHEDAVQAGFAVAEHLGGVERPWKLDNPSGRIVVPSQTLADLSKAAA
jgi:predicted NAD/FAD-binding protein